jgi:hypothetical protein
MTKAFTIPLLNDERIGGHGHIATGTALKAGNREARALTRRLCLPCPMWARMQISSVVRYESGRLSYEGLPARHQRPERVAQGEAL